jgi:hypothetical protein
MKFIIMRPSSSSRKIKREKVKMRQIQLKEDS